MKWKNLSCKAVGVTLAMTLICGVLYTLVVTGIGQIFFSGQVKGSVIEVDGIAYGSELIAQYFQDERHMWGRVMNVDGDVIYDKEGNALLYASPSNLSPKSEEYKVLVEERINLIKASDPTVEMEKIPVDLVTCSGSGLDPSISKSAAYYQVSRIAKANDISEDEVIKIIDKCTDKKLLGILGEETVNVLKVNLTLEGILE